MTIMKRNIDFTPKLKYGHTSVPARRFRIILPRAPAATLPMVSLAEDLPPPYKRNMKGIYNITKHNTSIKMLLLYKTKGITSTARMPYFMS